MARVLIAYQVKHGLRTIQQIIERWAPANENDTAAYVRAVSADTGVSADQPLDMHAYADLKPLVEAIIKHENGQQRYTTAQVDKALVLAGVEPPAKNLQHTRTVRGGKAPRRRPELGTTGGRTASRCTESLKCSCRTLMWPNGCFWRLH